MRTEKEICTLCYDIQDACNFFPVVMELSRTLQDLKACGIEYQNLNSHPAIIILVDKINDMILRPDLTKVMNAFDYCQDMKEKLAPIIEVP